MEVRIESGMEMQTISVLKQLPRNSRTPQSQVSERRDQGFTNHPSTAAWTNSDWSPKMDSFKAPADSRHDLGKSVFWAALTIARVDAFPLRVTVSMTSSRPLVRVMFCCVAKKPS